MRVYLRNSVRVVTRIIPAVAVVCTLLSNPVISVRVEGLIGGGGSGLEAPLTTEDGFVLTTEAGLYIQYEA